MPVSYSKDLRERVIMENSHLTGVTSIYQSGSYRDKLNVYFIYAYDIKNDIKNVLQLLAIVYAFALLRERNEF